MDNEKGGQRIQRTPPTERKGRVHTSTVTVAVIDPTEIKAIEFNQKDFKIEWYSGTGNGGQFKNKHQNSIRITHIPTQIMRTAQTRSRQNSYKLALDALLITLSNVSTLQSASKINNERKLMIGSGERGDKIRTYRFQDNIVTDHITGKSAQISKVLTGNFDLLW